MGNRKLELGGIGELLGNLEGWLVCPFTHQYRYPEFWFCLLYHHIRHRLCNHHRCTVLWTHTHPVGDVHAQDIQHCCHFHYLGHDVFAMGACNTTFTGHGHRESSQVSWLIYLGTAGDHIHDDLVGHRVCSHDLFGSPARTAQGSV